MQEEEGATRTKRWTGGKRPDIRDYIRIHKIWNRLVLRHTILYVGTSQIVPLIHRVNTKALQ